MRPDNDLIQITPVHMSLQITRLASLLGGLRSWAEREGVIWKNPALAVDYDGTLLLEWWVGKRTLAIYLNGDWIWYYGLDGEGATLYDPRDDEDVPRTNEELEPALAWLYALPEGENHAPDT